MIKFAIVDDYDLFREMSFTIISALFEKKNRKALGKTFSSAKEFLKANQNEKFDILFTDIIMPEMSGLELSKKLRERKSEVLLFFITGEKTLLPDTFEYKPLGFINKDNFTNDADEMINLALEEIDSKFISIETSENRIIVERKINIDDIYLIEKNEHYILVHTSISEEPFRVYKSLRYFNKLEQLKKFVQINEGQIINIKYVTKIEKMNIYVNINGKETEFQLSRRRLKDAEDAFYLWHCGSRPN